MHCLSSPVSHTETRCYLLSDSISCILLCVQQLYRKSCLRPRQAHVSLLVIINHPYVILTSWTNKLMEYVSGQPPAFRLWIPGHCLRARKRASQEALQPIKNVLKHKIYNAAHIPTELQFHFHQLGSGKATITIGVMWKDNMHVQECKFCFC